MTRGNQRDKAREANLKKQAAQKKSNGKSGAEQARDRDALAAKMREKQRLADAKKAAAEADAAKSGKK